MYQGLDVVIFGPLKKSYGFHRAHWEREFHEKVSKKNFLAILGAAYTDAVTVSNVQAAFRKTSDAKVQSGTDPNSVQTPNRTL